MQRVQRSVEGAEGVEGTERYIGCRGSVGVEGVQKDAELIEDQQDLTSPLAHFQS